MSRNRRNFALEHHLKQIGDLHVVSVNPETGAISNPNIKENQLLTDPIPKKSVNTDIPGSLYADLALHEIERMKLAGYDHAELELESAGPIEVNRNYREFKAIMRDKGFKVEIKEIKIKAYNTKVYKLLITW